MIDPILMELDAESHTTRRVLECVPEDKLSWRPHPKSFSMGQLALHIAGMPAQVSRLVVPDTMEAPGFQQMEPRDKAEIMDTLLRSVAEAREVLMGMDDMRLLESWSLTRNGRTVMQVPRIGFLRAILLNHWYHHRGQLSVYLRMHDVPLPSIYGPTADENPFA